MNPQEIPQTQETPEAYNLSSVEDLGKLSDTLTLAERNILREKFVQEKQAIIYLTKSEVQSLKDTLSASGNAHMGTRVERITNFLEQQKSEGLHLGDIFEGSSEIPKEALTQIENISKESLFGPSGALKDISLSETAKNNIISAFALAALSEIGTTTSVDSPDVIALLEGSAKNLKLLGEAASLKETVGPGIEKRALDIDAKGEQNSIFMNVQEGKLFFTQLFKGDYTTTQEVIDALEGKNIPVGENIPQISAESMKELETIATQDIQNVPENTQDIIAPETQEELGNLPDEEKKSLLDEWKESGNPLLQILAALLEFGKEISGNKDSDTSKESGTQDTKTEKDKTPDAANTPDGTEFTLNAKKIAIQHNWVQEQIGNTVQDTQKPTQTEILSILKNFQNSDFSDAKKQPENSAQAIYAVQVALSNQGIDAGVIDGVFGPKTQEGIKSYQKSLDLSETGVINTALFSKLIEKLTPTTPEK